MPSKESAAGACTQPALSAQAIYSAGAFHPTVAQDIEDALAQGFSPQDYPPPLLWLEGFRCGCLAFYTDPCRVQFRQARSGARMRAWLLRLLAMALPCCQTVRLCLPACQHREGVKGRQARGAILHGACQAIQPAAYTVRKVCRASG